MRIKLLLFVTVIGLGFTGSAQNLNLRKAILKSDFIFASDDFKYDTIAKNDFTTEYYIAVNKIDTILKNKLSAIPKKLTIRNYTDGEDYYSSLLTNGGGCVLNPSIGYQGRVYYNLFFVCKVGKEYQILAFFNSIEYKEYANYMKQIQTIKNIEQIKDLKIRFDKSLDWFIDNGLMPDYDFMEYYKEKELITDMIQYTEKQQQNALVQFEKGEEALLPIVKSKYKNNVKNYFVTKLKGILEKDKLDYNDYYEFYETVNKATDDFGKDGYDSTDYLLNSNITADKFEEYDKKKIMEHLLHVVKNWE
ncbi:hypothetical protein [Flavobacterium chilense]|uniref:Uncharacterized protein n=1 Tax=Flavobacterium chilense TaxID=946677 RepID=A0A1M7D165_9FLAO|nr:hypothetical protein [Flavobacterium chilense]SHL73262.1 hypothetical protein SAMN05444484_102385 [Flavobacterium chilense]